MHKLQSDNHAIFVNSDKTPGGEHIRIFNAPVVDAIVRIMIGDRTATNKGDSSLPWCAFPCRFPSCRVQYGRAGRRRDASPDRPAV
ncbi:unnamed protein product [Euphydryas editha]|uniref:Uncharacterized protein n=1 Tax=Euphydryas editha TaxID=104508 RepID=A0AAU9V6K5_EUPED|nr:unnamed protein product [Euphydryas editha]